MFENVIELFLDNPENIQFEFITHQILESGRKRKVYLYSVDLHGVPDGTLDRPLEPTFLDRIAHQTLCYFSDRLDGGKGVFRRMDQIGFSVLYILSRHIEV